MPIFFFVGCLESQFSCKTRRFVATSVKQGCKPGMTITIEVPAAPTNNATPPDTARSGASEVSVAVPDGLQPGDVFIVEINGENAEIEVPEGCGPGTSISIPAPSQEVELTVPDGCKPGDAVAVDVNGKDVEVTIPDGYFQGMSFLVAVPATVVVMTEAGTKPGQEHPGNAKGAVTVVFDVCLHHTCEIKRVPID